MKKIFYFLIYAVYFAMPIESISFFDRQSIVKIIVTILFFVSVFYIKRIKISVVSNTLIKLFALYFYLAALSLLWSIDKDITMFYSFGTLFPIMILCVILYYAIQTVENIQNIFKAYVLGCFVISISIMYTFTNNSSFAYNFNLNQERLTVFGQDQNELSYLLSFGIVSIIYIINFMVNKRVIKIMYLSLGYIFALIIMLTGSRTGFINIIVICLLIVIMNYKHYKNNFYVPILFAAALLMFYYLPEHISGRLLETVDEIQNKKLTGRVDIWTYGLMAFNENGSYLLGTGFKTFRKLLETTYNISVAPHNTYLSTLVELGIIGLSLYLMIIIYLIKKVFYLCKNYSIFYIMLILPLLISMFTLGIETRRWIFMVGILIVRISDILQNKNREIVSCKMYLK